MLHNEARKTQKDRVRTKTSYGDAGIRVVMKSKRFRGPSRSEVIEIQGSERLRGHRGSGIRIDHRSERFRGQIRS